MSQKELAEALGSTQGTISAWERGASSPDYDMLIRIADLFDVSTDFLIGRSDTLHTDGRPSIVTPNTFSEKAGGSVFDPEGVSEREVKPAKPAPAPASLNLDLSDGMSYADISEEGKAELYKFLQYLRMAYPRKG